MPNSRQTGLKLAGAYIDATKYEQIQALAKANHRTLAEQCRALFDAAISNPASIPDAEASMDGSLPDVADGVEVDFTGLPMDPFAPASWKPTQKPNSQQP